MRTDREWCDALALITPSLWLPFFTRVNLSAYFSAASGMYRLPPVFSLWVITRCYNTPNGRGSPTGSDDVVLSKISPTGAILPRFICLSFGFIIIIIFF